MFSQVVTKLISGQFICAVSHPEAFQYLTDPSVRGGMTHAEDVNQYVFRIGMKLSRTESGQAFFVTWVDIDDLGKKAAKKQFADAKNELRFYVDFLKLVMDSTGKSHSINHGEKFNMSQLMGLISQNPSLMEALRKVANIGKAVSSDGNDRSRLAKIVGKLRNDGIVEEMNKDQEIFQFTGKVEYLQDVVKFVTENDVINAQDQAFDNMVVTDEL
ncbi:hypothetical protein IFT69_15100 [Pseudomonas putida]|nr:hypothetical protein [Pseudomonas putida]